MLRIQKAVILAMVAAMSLVPPRSVRGGVSTKAIRESVEWITGKLGSRATRKGAERLAPRLERLGLTHGDEVVKLIARRGDDAMWITAQPRSLALFVRHGGDVEQALIKHRALAADVIEKFGAPAGRALGKLNGQGARRLAMMADELARIGRCDELLDVVARFGDRGCDFVWRNKGALATASVLAAFLADPEPFIDGTRDLTGMAAEHVVQPLVEAGGQAAAEAARGVNWTLIGLVGMLLVAVPRLGRRMLARACPQTKTGETPAPQGR